MGKKTYFVIGSNCFTGSHIVEALLANTDNYVVGISRSPEYKDLFLPYKKMSTPNFHFYQIDVVKEFNEIIKLLNQIEPNIVINVAALSEVGLSNEQPVEYFEINTLATVQLCNYLRTCSYLENYIHISSAEIFGSCDAAIDEKALLNPSTPYAVSKAAADMYLNTIRQNFGFPVTIIRSTNVYGKHQQLFKILPRTIIYLKLNKTIELHGGGLAIKSFIHINDVVKGILSAIEKRKVDTFHFTNSSSQTIADIVHLICNTMGYSFDKSTSSVGERLGQDAKYSLDSSKAQKELEWSPEIVFEQGIKDLISWIEYYWDEILLEPLNYVHKI